MGGPQDFSLAADGISHSEIARILNEEGIPTRYMYHKLKSDNFPDKQPHVKIKMWSNDMIKEMITNETYLGTMIWNKAKCGMDTNKKRVVQPKEDWIIVKNQHDAIVSKDLFDRANANIAGLVANGNKAGKKNLFFICGCCGKGLQHRNRKNGSYYCRGGTLQVENDCQKVNVKQSELENMVMCQVRGMADMLIETRTIRKKARGNDRRAVLETMLADGAKEIALWKDTKIHLYERYKSGAITRESYVAQIENGKARMEELEQIRSEALAELDSMQTMTSTEEIADAELAELSVVEAFNKDKLKALIDRVIVYDADTVEVIWKVDNPFRSEVSA